MIISNRPQASLRKMQDRRVTNTCLQECHHRCDKIGKKMEKANLGKGPATKSDESFEKILRPLTPHPHFWKIILHFFMIDMVADVQGGMRARECEMHAHDFQR